MKKLRLDLDQITVDRFETDASEGVNGTVMGQDMLITGKTACLGSCIVDSCVTGSQHPCPNCP